MWAYPSQDVFGQWRPRELVKYAQRNEDHLRAAGHRAKAKTRWLGKSRHVEEFTQRARMLDGHINTSANTNWSLAGKKNKRQSKALLMWHESPATSARTHSVGTQRPTQTATPPCPLVTG